MENDNKPLGIEAEGHEGWHEMQIQIYALRDSGYVRDRDGALVQEASELITKNRHGQVGRVQSCEVDGEKTIVHLLDGGVEVVEGKHTLFEAAEILKKEVVTNSVSSARKRRG